MAAKRDTLAGPDQRTFSQSFHAVDADHVIDNFWNGIVNDEFNYCGDAE